MFKRRTTPKTSSNKFFNSIASVFSTSIIAIIIISYSIVGLTIASSIAKSTKENTIQHTKQILDQNGIYINLISDTLRNYYRQLQGNTDYVRLVTGVYDSDTARTEALTVGRRALDAIRKSNNYIDSIIYVNPDGLSFGVPYHKFLNFEESELYDSSIYNKAWENENQFLWVPSTLHPIYAADYDTIQLVKSFRESTTLNETGIIIFTLKPKVIQAALNEVQLGSEGSLYILNQEGYVISHQDESLLGTTNEKFQSIINTINEHETDHHAMLKESLVTEDFKKYEELQKDLYQYFVLDNKSDGDKKLLSYSILKDNNWYIVGETAYEDLTKNARGISQIILLVVVIMSIISIPISITITGWITKPVKNIITVMTLFEKGDRTVRIEHPYPYEFSRLKNSFNTMANQLNIDFVKINKQEKELIELNNSLEQRVQDRTRELEVSLTHLKEAQRKLIESEKQAALGYLIAGIAHEINTPVGTCLTSSTFLASELDKMTQLFNDGTLKKKDMNNYLDGTNAVVSIIIDELQKTTQIIEAFKGISVASDVHELRNVNLKEFVRDTISAYGELLSETSCTVEISIDDSYSVRTYQGALYQLFDILITNSLMHAFEDTVSRVITLEADVEENHFVLTYSDNGKGISAESITKIFEPFYTTRFGEGGRGLGLHIAYNIVTSLLLGEIECHSLEGKGTSFIIKLPKNRELGLMS